MLNFDDEIVLIKFKGKEFEIKKPTHGQIKSYSKSLKDCLDDESKEKALEEFLQSLGMVKELYEALTPGQLKAVLSSLYESEKN